MSFDGLATRFSSHFLFSGPHVRAEPCQLIEPVRVVNATSSGAPRKHGRDLWFDQILEDLPCSHAERTSSSIPSEKTYSHNRSRSRNSSTASRRTFNRGGGTQSWRPESGRR